MLSLFNGNGADLPEAVKPPGNKLFTIIMALFSISLLINIGVLTFVVIDSQYTDTRICNGQNEVRRTIRDQISKSGENLKNIEYYKEHPSELKQAQDDNRDSLARFAPIPCKRAPFHNTPIE